MEFSVSVLLGMFATLVFVGVLVYTLKLKVDEEKRFGRLESRVQALEFKKRKPRNRSLKSVPAKGKTTSNTSRQKRVDSV